MLTTSNETRAMVLEVLRLRKGEDGITLVFAESPFLEGMEQWENTSKRYPAEVRQRAVRLFQEHRTRVPLSRWEAMKSITETIGCTAEALRPWVLKTHATVDPRRNTAVVDRERVKQLGREKPKLRRVKEFLRKASAFFALAELDRCGK